MLSIQPLKSAQGAQEYYTKAFNYYAQDATAVRWLGQGSKILELGETVDKSVMLALLEGNLPDGQQLQSFDGKHRPGFDLTFSAPKSVSILVGLGVAPELIKFHDQAVAFAISKIEQEFAQARITQNGETHYKNTENLIFAAFRQPTSRANEPALHTHCVGMNITFDQDKARSLASDASRKNGVLEQIQNNAHYCGLLYRQHLANSLKSANYHLKRTKDGLFEIDGIPDDVLKEFSSRRQDIEQSMDDNSWTGAKMASKATILTRPNKDESDPDTLLQDWQNRAAALKFDAQKFIDNRDKVSTHIWSVIKEKVYEFFKPFETPSEARIAEACVHVAIETLSQKTSVFSERNLKTESMKHGLVCQYPVSEKAIGDAISQQKLQHSLYEGYCQETKQTLLTTPWLLTLEAETIARIANNKDILKPVATLKATQEFQKHIDKISEFPMTHSQKQAMNLILTTKDRYIAIQGYAGVAKTTMLSHAKILIEKQGYELRGITVASSAANELNTKASIKSDVFPIVHQELKNAKLGSLAKTIFIVDEASMLSSAQGHELVKLIERANARLVLVGDKAQLASINHGRIFGLSQEYDINTALMDEIVRQKNPHALEAVQHATRGEVSEAIAKLAHVEELSTHEDRVQWIADKWLSLSQDERKNTLLFAATNNHRLEITALLRSGLEKEGLLSEFSYQLHTLKPKIFENIELRKVSYYKSHDVLRFNTNFNKIKSGEYYKIAPITKEHRTKNVLPLIAADGKKLSFPLKNLPQYKTHTSAFERLIEVYQTNAIDLKIGDTVMWNRNFKSCEIRNGQRAILKSINDKELIFTTDQNKELVFDKNHPALKHIDYGYVLTNYKAQGKDAQNAIGLMESYHKFSATLKNFYVQISRGISGMTLVTDNKELLAAAIKNNRDEKPASLDIISSQQLKNHDARFKEQLSIQPVINKKIQLELAR